MSFTITNVFPIKSSPASCNMATPRDERFASCLSNSVALENNIVGYKYVNMGKMMDNIKAGMEPMAAIEKASGTYGRFDEAVKKIDPRKE